MYHQATFEVISPILALGHVLDGWTARTFGSVNSQFSLSLSFCCSVRASVYFFLKDAATYQSHPQQSKVTGSNPGKYKTQVSLDYPSIGFELSCMILSLSRIPTKSIGRWPMVVRWDVEGLDHSYTSAVWVPVCHMRHRGLSIRCCCMFFRRPLTLTLAHTNSYRT